MQITRQFIITCERAFLTAGSNNLNMIGVFTTIGADTFPFTYPQFALVVNFDIDHAGTHTLQTDIHDPAGTRIAHTELPVQATPGNLQIIANFEHMKFAAPGAYTIRVSLDGESIGTRTIQINPLISPRSQRKPNLA